MNFQVVWMPDALRDLAAIWLAVPEAWNAVGWAALAFWLAFAGYTLAQEELSYQANVVAIAASICTLIVNLEDDRLCPAPKALYHSESGPR